MSRKVTKWILGGQMDCNRELLHGTKCKCKAETKVQEVFQVMYMIMVLRHTLNVSDF